MNLNQNRGHDYNGVQIMISYNQRSSGLLAQQIYEALTSFGFNVWFDSGQMHGNLRQRMAEGVLYSKIILCLITDGYLKSENCIDECEYAKDNKRSIIPIKVNKDYNLTERLSIDFFLRKIMYVDFSKNNFDQSFAQLIHQIDLVLENFKE